jgi:hypothetical protein
MNIAAIRNGMTVYSKDGRKLGKIIGRQGEDLLIEKGLFFKKDYVVSADDVDGFDGEQVWLHLAADQIEAASEGHEDEVGQARQRREASGAGRPERLSADDDGVVIEFEEEVVTVVSDPEPDQQDLLHAPPRDPNARR